jgi:hypothetical protein
MMFVAGLLARFGVADAAAKKLAPFAAVAAVVAMLGLLWGAVQVWDYFDDRAAIHDDRIEREAAETAKALERERAATKAAMDRDAQRAADSAATVQRLEDIEDANPEAAVAPARPGSRAVADRLRRDGDRRR